MDVLRSEETGVSTQQSKTWNYILLKQPQYSKWPAGALMQQTQPCASVDEEQCREREEWTADALFLDGLKVAFQQFFCVHVHNDLNAAEHTGERYQPS